MKGALALKGTAVVFEDRGKVQVREVEIPEPTASDVVIDIECSWISIGTESSFLRGERISGEQMYQPGDPWPFPQVAGYQKVGVVRSVGADVRGLSIGDRVFASVSGVANMFFDHGGHVSPAVTPAHQVWKLPDNARAEDYAGMVLTQVGYNCGARPWIRPRDTAVVIGDGLVGQWAAQTLHHRGADVVVLGRHDARLAHLPSGIARVNTRRVSLDEALSTCEGVHVVVDTVGDMNTFGQLRRFMVRDSHLVSAGFLGDRGTVDIQSLREQEITLHTPSGWTKKRMDETRSAIEAGWLLTSPLVTHRFPVNQAKAAWDLIQAAKASVLGVLLDWG